MSTEQEINWLEILDSFQRVIDGMHAMSERDLSPEDRERLREVCLQLRRRLNPEDTALARIEQLVASLPEGRSLIREYLEAMDTTNSTKQ